MDKYSMFVEVLYKNGISKTIMTTPKELTEEEVKEVNDGIVGLKNIIKEQYSNRNKTHSYLEIEDKIISVDETIEITITFKNVSEGLD